MAESGENKTSTTIDRLSDLPDNIIEEILSFLDTKHAIRTCVLSKRWRYLWTSVPDISFLCKHPSDLNFTEFIYNVLSRRGDCNIRRLVLSSESGFRWGSNLISDITNYAVTHQVQDFEFAFQYLQSFSLPACGSLKTLRLSGSFFVSLSKSFGFALSNLTSMNLHSCRFCYQSDFGDPFSRCSNLRNLSLSYCGFQSLKKLKITGIQLLSLKMQEFDHWDPFNGGCKVEILAPNLSSFIYQSSKPVDFSALRLPSLNYVEVHVRKRCNWDYDKRKRSLYLIKMLEGLGNAQYIKLHPDTIKVLDGLLKQRSSPVKRLKNLEVLPNNKSFKIPERVRKYFLSGSDLAEMQYLEV